MLYILCETCYQARLGFLGNLFTFLISEPVFIEQAFPAPFSLKTMFVSLLFACAFNYVVVSSLLLDALQGLTVPKKLSFSSLSSKSSDGSPVWPSNIPSAIRASPAYSSTLNISVLTPTVECSDVYRRPSYLSGLDAS